MAITNIAACNTASAVPAGASTQFTTTGPFVLYCDGFKIDENALLLRLGPSGDYSVATNKEGAISVSAIPNTALVEAPGTYRIKKDATSSADVYVGYEEV